MTMGEAVDQLIRLAGVQVSAHTRVINGRVVHIDSYMRSLMDMSVDDLYVERDHQTDRSRYYQVINELRRRDAGVWSLPQEQDVLRHEDLPPGFDAGDRLSRNPRPNDAYEDILRRRYSSKRPEVRLPAGKTEADYPHLYGKEPPSVPVGPSPSLKKVRRAVGLSNG